MKFSWRFTFSFLIFLTGFWCAIYVTQEYVPVRSEVVVYTSFGDILLRNSCVSLLLSFGGALTGGVLTFAILMWNGFTLGRTFNVPVSCLSEVIEYHVFHGVTELVGLLMFAAIGFQGMVYVVNILKKKAFCFPQIEVCKLIIAFLILILSATIESSFMKQT